jgi:invasion protein IalB
MKPALRLLSLAGAIAFLPLAQAAPNAPPAKAESSAVPDSTSASFGTWTLRCQRASDASLDARVCEVAQSIHVQGQNEPIAQIAIGRIQKGQPLKLTAVLPPNVSFPSSVRVETDEKESAAIELPWRRCLPGACFADAPLTEAFALRLRNYGGNAKLQFKDSTGRDVVVLLPLRGLAPSLDALAREKE